jgi:hypothetical protein
MKLSKNVEKAVHKTLKYSNTTNLEQLLLKALLAGLKTYFEETKTH